jgi:hypothetical protein
MGDVITPAAFNAVTVVNDGVVIDSGASNHMVNRASMLRNLQPADTTVRTAKKARLTCTTKGEAIVKTRNNKLVLLSDVVLLPALTCNLLSVSKASEAGYKVEFTRNGQVFFTSP